MSPFQQLKTAVPRTWAQAMEAGVQIFCVNSSATIDFECCSDDIAVLKMESGSLRTSLSAVVQ